MSCTKHVRIEKNSAFNARNRRCLRCAIPGHTPEASGRPAPDPKICTEKSHILFAATIQPESIAPLWLTSRTHQAIARGSQRLGPSRSTTRFSTSSQPAAAGLVRDAFPGNSKSRPAFSAGDGHFARPSAKPEPTGIADRNADQPPTNSNGPTA